MAVMLYVLVLLSVLGSCAGIGCTSRACISVPSVLIDAAIYCEGPLLDRIQMAAIFPDSKTFVDMPMKVPPDQILTAFSALPTNASFDDLMNFTNTYFYPSGYEVRSIVPNDWEPNPSFLSSIFDPLLRAWALAVHGKWRNLVRIFSQTGTCGVQCYSSIQVPYPFVVAGGRFNEFYYWDSMWIVDGLLVSGMTNTTRDFLSNFLYLVQTYGFVPNGGRVYYLDRSQPPVLTQLVKKYVDATNDSAFLAEALPTLDLEYQFWAQNRNVSLQDKAGCAHFLNNYNVSTTLPRPESYLNDVTTAQAVPAADRPALWGEIATGAETGWDFSSRWFGDGYNLSTIQAKSTHTILYANEVVLYKWHAAAGNKTMAAYYMAQSQARLTAIQTFLWNEEQEMWTDYNHVTNKQSNSFYPSNFTPLWANATQMTQAEIVSLLLKHSPLWNYPAGVPTSLVNTTQQWDFPNAWAPLQYWIIEALHSQPKTVDIATSLIQRWITTNYCAWNNTGGNVSGIMFEKYNAVDVGQPGQGGEYAVQDGFGWTNGVVLRYLTLYGSSLMLPPSCPSSSVHSFYVNAHHDHVDLTIDRHRNARSNKPPAH